MNQAEKALIRRNGEGFFCFRCQEVDVPHTL